MTGTYRYGLFVVFLIVAKDCYTIPLPGVKSHLIYQNTDSSYFPDQESVFQNEIDFKPSFRNVVPNFSSNESFRPVSIDVHQDKPTTTISPYEKLLDKLYGNDKWRSLLEQDGKGPTISTTRIPSLAETKPISSFQGFYTYEISGSKFNGLPKISEKITTPPIVTSQYDRNSGNSKFMMKITGVRQHVFPDSPNLNSQKSEVKNTELGAFSKDDGASSMFFKGQDGISQQHLTMQQPIMSVTQNPQMTAGGSIGFDPNQVNANGENRPQSFINSGVNTFNPNEINSKQNLFQPNSAFLALITQTGSDPNNRQLPVAYDADAINERYIEHVNSLFKGQTGQATETIFGTQQYGYRFSAYGDAKPQPYNADALNREMMENNQHMAQNTMNSILLSGIKDQQTTSSTEHQIPTVTNNTDQIAIHKNDNYANLKPNTKMWQTSTPKTPLRFGFIPGNLFPGQSQTIAGHHQNLGEQKGMPPQFLRHIPVAIGNNAFNPDKINAAQNAYDPNAISWVKSRDTEKLGKREINDAVDVTAILAPPIHKYTTTTTKQPEHAYTTHSTDVNSTHSTSSSEIEKSTTGTNSGFDPNALNSIEGQTNFIPGQIAPNFSGYNQNSYGQLLSNEKQQTAGLGRKDGAKITFDIAHLLGVKATVTDNNSFVGYGQGTMPLFNPNSANNLMKIAGESKNSSSNMAGFGMDFMGTGFDPNAANKGFSNILGSDKYGFSQGNNLVNRSVPNAYGYGGFDPNSANTGFGKAGFGVGNSEFSGGGRYMTAFDPNKVNQMAVKNPFEQKSNDTSYGGTTSYFLGIVSGIIGQSNQYNSAYMSAFNPDSVNVAPYDPNKYNQVHLHLDPLDMLSKNPGIDNDTLVAAASAFDPDKINYPNMQQALSPAAMISSNPGINVNTLLNLKLDPYKPTSVDKNTSTSSTGIIQSPGNSSANKKQVQTGFDPVALMSKLMQSASAFQPGNGGVVKQNHDPSSMIASNSNAHEHSTTPSKVPPLVQTSTSKSTKIYGPSNSPISSTTSSTLSITTSTASTNSPKNAVIG